jgi:hypothetical protein
MEMFAGTGGSGVMDMPSEHSKIMQKKCVTCHMHKEDDSEVVDIGGHTFRADKQICMTCHDDYESLVSQERLEIEAMLHQLKELLDKNSDNVSRHYRDAELNYNMVLYDGGMGFHNPKYAKALLRYSISKLSVSGPAGAPERPR